MIVGYVFVSHFIMDSIGLNQEGYGNQLWLLVDDDWSVVVYDFRSTADWWSMIG